MSRETSNVGATGTVEAELQPEASAAETPSAEPASGESCPRCGQLLSVIRIVVDGTALLMESCDGCDARRWQLAGERIDLAEALHQVGEHAGRRR